jgi:hypothetical protein
MLTDAEVELMETREENRRLEAEVARLRGVVSDLEWSSSGPGSRNWSGSGTLTWEC